MIIPVVLQIAVLAVLFGSDSGSVPDACAVSCFTAYPVGAWLALTIANTEDPIQRTVTIAAAAAQARSRTRARCSSRCWVTWCSRFLSVGWGVAAAHGVPPAVVATGVLGHLAAAGTGTALGLLCAPRSSPESGGRC